MSEKPPAYPRTKLHRPYALSGWIERPRLLELLDQVLEKPIALVSAPAGFGKTTLLAQWLERCPLPNAWLQLDETDHELPLFMKGVAAALRQIFPDCLQKTADLLRASGAVPLAIWKSALIDDLELLEGSPFILAMDDYHLLANPSTDLLLADILGFATQPMHLILSARRSPSLSFSRLKAQRQVVDIRSADLRFTDSEAFQYFMRIPNLPLSDSDLRHLQEKTEGWAAGLTLAAISLRDEAQPERFIARLDGADSQISDYLLDQVFNSQPVEIQEFLLKAATFDQFSASMLCEALEPRHSEGAIQALLERIETAQLFLVPLDSQRTSYRFHHLFRQMLLARQRFLLSPEQIARFHQRAAGWFIRQGRIDEALSHLLAIQDWTGAARLVESQLCALLNAEDFQDIRRRLGYFSEDFIASRPGLLLMQAWIAHFGLRLPLLQTLCARIQAFLDTAEQPGFAGGGAPLPGFEAITYSTAQAQVWMLESIRYYLTNQGRLAAPLARKAVEALPESWQFARGNGMIYLGLSMAMEGQVQQAIALIQHEYTRLQNPDTTYGARLLFCLSVIYLLNGELELCRQTTEQMLSGSLSFDLMLMQGWGYYLLGRVYQEWNQLDLAARYYLQVVEQRFTSNLMPAIESIAGYAYLLQLSGRGEEAQEFLGALKKLHSEQTAATPMPVMALVAWLKLSTGSPDQARRWAEAFNAPVSEQAIGWYHLPQLYKAKILMDRSGPDHGGVVDALLDEILELAERTHNTFTRLRVLALQAVRLARRGEDAAAQQTLAGALRLGQPGRFILTFVEEGPEMLALLRATVPMLQGEPGLEQYAAAIMAAFAVPDLPQRQPSRPGEAQTLLTERELEVLELLAERLSINEIALRLCISPNTVQQHTHHIYRKLNVTKKRQAVARAIEQGIIPPGRQDHPALPRQE